MRASSRQDLKPEALREIYGIRFHHFKDLSGRLVATIATEPTNLDPHPTDPEALIDVSCAVCSLGDSPSRQKGRMISLGRLEVGKCRPYRLDTLKARISDRSLLLDFVSDSLARKLGYESLLDFLANLRPRLPFPTEKEGV